MGALLSAARGRRIAAGGVVLAAILAALVRRATVRRLRRVPSQLHPKEDEPSGEPSGNYRTCLDRPWVQKEIGWAVEQGKKIITIYEDDNRRPGHFDLERATERYSGTKWAHILALAAIPYRRDKHDADAMLNKIFDRATGGSVKGRGKINPPYRWEFFLSHHQVSGGDQVMILYHLLAGKNKATWLDKYTSDQSEAAMEEGVRYSKYFLLFLTSDPTTSSDVVNVRQPEPETVALDLRSGEPDAGQDPATEPAADLSALCRTPSASQRAKDRLRTFTDRPVLRQHIVDWAFRDDAPDDEHRCLVLGEPGSGKTTLLSRLTHEDKEFQSVVLAHHFCEAALEPTLRPSTFVQSVTKQLYLNAPEYKAHVDANRNLSDIVRRILKGSEEVEPDQQRQPLIDLTEGVLDPLRTVYPGTTKPRAGHVLVVDSLDEALLPFKDTTHTESRSIVYLLKHCHITGLFPTWMKVLATSRRDVPQVSHLRTWHRIDMVEHRTETDGVFQAHINSKLSEPGSKLLARAGGVATESSSKGFHCNTEASEYFARLVMQADGIFQYLDTALNDIARGFTKLNEVPSLPGRLGELYGHFFERAFGDARSTGYKRVRPVFDAVAASDGGVPKTFLKNVLSLADPRADQRDVTERFQSVGEFLRHIHGPEPATAVDRSSSAAPECARGHPMKTVTTQNGRYCDRCRKTMVVETNSFRCDGCDYDICSECAHGSPLSRLSASSLGLSQDPERQTFYHQSLGEWLGEEQDYRVCKEDGHKALGVIHFAALATHASTETLDAFAKVCVEHLQFPEGLKGTDLAMLRRRAQDDEIRGDVYALMSHLGKALHFYCCDMKVVGELLVDAGIPKDELCPWDGEWAHKRGVCRAAGEGDLAALRLFLAAQADLQCSTGGLSPLHWAVMKDQRAAISILSAGYGAALDIPATPAGSTPLHLAAQGRVECMRKLFASRVAGDVNATDAMGLTALHMAAKGSFVNEIAELCDQAADLEAKERSHEWTPLHIAAHSGQIEAVRVLIEKGADANARSERKFYRTPLHLACARDCVDVSVSALCSAPDIDLDAQDSSGWTALHWACTKGNAQAVQELLAANADASLLSKTGDTALHWACHCSNESRLDIVDALLQVPGVVIHSQNDSLVTPLQWACGQGHTDVVERLCDADVAGALGCVDSSGRTSLHWASREGNQRSVLHLLRAGAAVDARDRDGRTPLHLAAHGVVSQGTERTIMILVRDFGADVLAETNEGETPLQLAKDRGEMLRNALRTAETEHKDTWALEQQIQTCKEIVETLRRLSMYADRASDSSPDAEVLLEPGPRQPQ